MIHLTTFQISLHSKTSLNQIIFRKKDMISAKNHKNPNSGNIVHKKVKKKRNKVQANQLRVQIKLRIKHLNNIIINSNSVMMYIIA